MFYLYYPIISDKCGIIMLIQEIQHRPLIFCMETLKTGYLVMEKQLVIEILKTPSQLTGYLVKFHSSSFPLLTLLIDYYMHGCCLCPVHMIVNSCML